MFRLVASEVLDIVQLTNDNLHLHSYHSHVKRTGHRVFEVLPDIQYCAVLTAGGM
jgi:hypothetical protein